MAHLNNLSVLFEFGVYKKTYLTLNMLITMLAHF